MAATSMKLEGKRSVMAERAMLSDPSSSGWRSISRTSRGNSGNSSRKRMPFCARLASPGRGMPAPPPIRPASEMVWWGERKGRSWRSPAPGPRVPAMLWTLVVSMASSKVSGGRMPARRLASMVLPEPGGPIMRTFGAILRPVEHAAEGRLIHHLKTMHAHGGEMPVPRYLFPGLLQNRPAFEHRFLALHQLGHPPNPLIDVRQIGTASCRERG